MKKKTGVVITSAAAIAICSGLIVGSTMAMFSSESSINIAASSGKLKVSARIGEITAATSLDSSFSDTDASTVYFQAGQKGSEEGDLGFGYAHIENGTVTLNNITPGDSVSFDITIQNDSTVPVRYATKYSCNNGYLLAHGLNVEINGASQDHVQSFTSAWNDLAVNESPSESVSVRISLPNRENATDNGYQGLSTNFTISVEVVQSNAEAPSEATYVPFPEEYETLAKLNAENKLTMLDHDSETTLADYLSSREETYVVLNEDLALSSLAIPADVAATKVVDLNGHTLSIVSQNGYGIQANSNVTFMNGKIEAEAQFGVSLPTRGVEVTLKNIDLSYRASDNPSTAALRVANATLNMTGGSLTVNGASNGIYTDGGAQLLLNGVDYKINNGGAAFFAKDTSVVSMNGGSVVIANCSLGLVRNGAGTIAFENVKNVVDGAYRLG